MWTFFSISIILINISILLLIRRYAAGNVEWIVRIATAYAWLTSMCIVALVPIDVFATLTQQPTYAISIMWNIAYWSTQLATWIILPFYQVYSEAGDFSIRGRAWTSIKENGILYGSAGALGAIGISLLLFTKRLDVTGLMGLGIGLSNTFGLVAGILLLGYGLVEIPRELWKSANPETAMKWSCHRAGKFAEAVMKTTVELETVITIIYANQRQMRRHDPLRKYMDIIAEYAEKHSPVKPSELARRQVDIDHLRAEDLEYNYDKSGLADLRRRMFYAVSEYNGARCQYEEVMLEAFELEDIIKCRQLREYTPRVEPAKARPWTRPVWLYKCMARPYANKVYSVLLVVVSLCIIWGEFTIPISQPDMSPFSLAIRGAHQDEFSVQFLTLMPLVYICACMYFTLFRINAFNYNKLIPRATTGAALMQNGSLMCRFAAPTCWNFYHIIRMAKDVCDTCDSTVFSRNMASMDVLLFHNFNQYLPVILVVHCAITALNLWDKILNCCTSPRYKFSTDDVEDEYTEKGRLLVRKEQEATLKGFAIGEVLHSAYFDLEFPAITQLKAKKNQSRGFMGMFTKKKTLDPEMGPTGSGPSVSGPAASSASASAKAYSSAAAQAATRWLKGGASAGNGGMAGGAASGNGSSGSLLDAGPSDRTSLLASRYDKGPMDSSASSGPGLGPAPAAGGGGGGRSSGLDGIFADLLKGPPATMSPSQGGAPPAAAPARGASSSQGAASGTGRLIIGRPQGGEDKETDSLLGGFGNFGKWGRS